MSTANNTSYSPSGHNDYLWCVMCDKDIVRDSDDHDHCVLVNKGYDLICQDCPRKCKTECGECVICEEAQIDPSESALCFVPNGEIDLDDALYPRDLDWGFDKPDVPYDTIYIFNKEEGDTTSDCISQYWQGIDLGSVLCHRRANMSWDEDKPDAPHTTVYIFDKEEEDEDE